MQVLLTRFKNNRLCSFTHLYRPWVHSVEALLLLHQASGYYQFDSLNQVIGVFSASWNHYEVSGLHTRGCINPLILTVK